MLVIQSKFWVESLLAGEQLDYADLDAAGQPLFKFDPLDVGTAQIDAAGMLAKVAALGGPAIRGSYTVPADFTFPSQTVFLTFATIPVSTVAVGDFVTCDMLDLNMLVTAWATLRTVNLGALGGGLAVIPAGTIINYAVFKV